MKHYKLFFTIMLCCFVSIAMLSESNAQNSLVYVNSSTSGSVGGVNFTDADILAFDPTNDTWSMFFDGSDVGITTEINGFLILPNGDILLTFNGSQTVTGAGIAGASDIVKFIPTSTGPNTVGSFGFALYFDGSDVGLSDASENIDAIGLSPDGNLIISTNGVFSAVGLSGDGEDLSEFTGTLGSTTSGIFSLYFDGSEVGLAGENIEGSWIDPAAGDIYITVGNAFIMEGICGDESDIYSFSPTVPGVNTEGTFNLVWDGSANDFAGQNINGLSLSGTNIGPSPAPCELIWDLELFVIGLALPNGLENSLISSLNNAKKSLGKGNTGAAINQLEAFINKIEDQRGNKIDEEDADELIADAQAIIDFIQSGLEKNNSGESLVSTDVKPDTYSLSQNYPNPFNPSTVIRYAVPEDARVSIIIYDVLGNQIAELVNGNVAAGNHEVVFDAGNFASGIYFYRLTAGSFTQINKMLLMK
ncbi:T9SS type A sorting domain-containing protein [Bacteroidota bacterium]